MRCKYRLVVVELLSVLVDGSEDVSQMLAAALRVHGIRPAAYELAYVAGLPLHRAAASLFPTGTNLHADAARTQSVVRAWVMAMRTHYASPAAIQSVAGLSTILASLRDQGVRIVFVTSLPREVVDVIVRDTEWYRQGMVDLVLAGDDSGSSTDGLVRNAMRCAAVAEPARVLSVGSSRAHLEESVSLGCAVLAARHAVGSDDTDRRLRIPRIRRMASILDVVALDETRLHAMLA